MNKWKSLPIWLQGGIVFGSVGVANIIIFLSLRIVTPSNTLQYDQLDSIALINAWIIGIASIPLSLFTTFTESYIGYLTTVILSVVNLFLLGALIGWIVGKRKAKQTTPPPIPPIQK